MKRIYVAMPYRANEYGTQEENIARAKVTGENINAAGYEAVVPHILLSYINEATDRAEALNECLRLVKTCDELWICSTHVTGGVAREIQHAVDNNIPVVCRGNNVL